MILSALAPMMAPHFGVDYVTEENPEPNALKQAEKPMNPGGRAPCPAVQNDGGTAGDAGNTSATAKTLGNDPSTGITG